MDLQKLLETHQRAIGELYVGNLLLQEELNAYRAAIAAADQKKAARKAKKEAANAEGDGAKAEGESQEARVRQEAS